MVCGTQPERARVRTVATRKNFGNRVWKAVLFMGGMINESCRLSNFEAAGFLKRGRAKG
jgi:hypothetical protein